MGDCGECARGGNCAGGEAVRRALETCAAALAKIADAYPGERDYPGAIARAALAEVEREQAR